MDAGVNIEKPGAGGRVRHVLTDRVTARTLVQVVALENADEHAEQLMSTFPVAGVSGTPSDRFGAANRARTHLCAGEDWHPVHSHQSCGVATRPDGTRPIFAIILNGLGGSTLPAAKERGTRGGSDCEPLDLAECFC